MTIKCWYFDVNELADPQIFNRAMDCLPWQERRDQVMRMKFDQGKRLTLGAGILAAWLLGQAVGQVSGRGLMKVNARDLALEFGPQGKPRLVHHPDIHFNLSHSGNLAVCAISDQPVGVDVEKIRPIYNEVAKRCFQPQEMDWLYQQKNTDFAFTRLWTRKESYIKMTGEGLSREMNTFSVLDPCIVGGQGWIKGKELPGHVISVCSPVETELQFYQWRIKELSSSPGHICDLA